MMKNRFLWAFEYVGAIFVLIVKRLPMIALYSLAFFTLFTIGSNLIHRFDVARDKKYYQNAPAANFINYTSFIVQPAREGEDVNFTLCRQHDRNYPVSGFRQVYAIPAGKGEDNRVFVYSIPVKGVVDSGNCQSFYIRQAEHHFTPGQYQLTLNIDFKVKYGFEKHVYIKSNIFNVREPLCVQTAACNTDIQIEINNLKQQILLLQQRIDQLGGGSVQGSSSEEGSQPRDMSAGSRPSTTEHLSSSEPSTPSPSPAPQPGLVRRVLDGVLSPLRSVL